MTLEATKEVPLLRRGTLRTEAAEPPGVIHHMQAEAGLPGPTPGYPEITVHSAVIITTGVHRGAELEVQITTGPQTRRLAINITEVRVTTGVPGPAVVEGPTVRREVTETRARAAAPQEITEVQGAVVPQEVLEAAAEAAALPEASGAVVVPVPQEDVPQEAVLREDVPEAGASKFDSLFFKPKMIYHNETY